MALAILELLDYDDSMCQFQIDTGTNTYYQLKVGTRVRRDLGTELVDQIFFSTPLGRNSTTDDWFGPKTTLSLPVQRLTPPVAENKGIRQYSYAQLFSYKTAEKISPAISRVLRLPIGIKMPSQSPSDYAAGFTTSSVAGDSPMTENTAFTPRHIPCYTPALSQQTSIDQLLGEVIKLAAPIVSKMIKGGGGSTAAPEAGKSGAENIVASLLQTLLGALGAGTNLSGATSRSVTPISANRFSRPFIMGIDDALIGAAIGQIVQVLPQIVNSANQKRVDMKKADNQLVGGILSDINKRLMMQQLADLQKQNQTADSPSNAQIQQLISLLQAVPSAESGSSPTATTQSVTYPVNTFSNRAILSFDLGESQEFQGGRYPLFLRGSKMLLKVRFDVGDPKPNSPLPKAILKVVVKDNSDENARLEKVFKQKDLMAGSVIECVFEPGELSHLPTGKMITVLAELRWLAGKTNREVRALGATEIVLVNKYFLTDSGKETGEEIELRDQQAYRAFWNKVWEAPVLDAASESKGRKKYSWELNANCRYSVLLTASQKTNGFMEPKMLLAKANPESLSNKSDGRMKAGIELSLAELNKLQSLWKNESIAEEKLQAFDSKGFIDGHASEFVQRLKLKGKAGQRGMVWVIPTFKMFGFEVGNANHVNAQTGQVESIEKEQTHLPMPVAARVIGLTARNY